MINFSVIDSIDYPNKSYLLQKIDDSLACLRVVCNGRHFPLDENENETDIKTHSLGLRILASLGALLTFPIILLALAVKWWKKDEWQGVLLHNRYQIDSNQDMDAVEELEEIEEEPVLEGQEEFTKFIQNECACVQHLDKTLPDPLPHSWREYGKEIGEYNQTLDDYIQGHDKCWPDHRPIHIQRLGLFSDIDLKIISITTDYLHIFHNLPIQFCRNILTMEELKTQYLKVSQETLQQPCATDKEKRRRDALQHWHQFIEERMKLDFPRKNGQYNADVAIELMEIALIPDLKDENVKNPQIIAFTNEDLYATQLTNFVFGCASLINGVGIWSNARFGDPSSNSQAFQTCLLRMMKIAAHEFGHMRGLPHCTHYECNIGGYMSLKELDSRPLLYCLQDTAKICYLTQISLLKQHKRLLEFFENFNQTYDLNCDFSKEVAMLKGRMSSLAQEEA